MFKSSSQVRFVCFLGYLICPVFFLLPFFFLSPLDYNYTGILNSPCKGMMLFPFLAFCILSFEIYPILKQYLPKSIHIPLFLITELACITTLFFPYSEKENALSSLHLLFAFLSLILVNFILFLLLSRFSSLLYLYLAFTFTSACIAFTAFSINGLSELIYACALSITVTKLYSLHFSTGAL